MLAIQAGVAMERHVTISTSVKSATHAHQMEFAANLDVQVVRILMALRATLPYLLVLISASASQDLPEVFAQQAGTPAAYSLLQHITTAVT